MTVSIVFILVVAIGVTGILAFLHCQYAVNDLTGQLQNEISSRIEEHLDTYLAIPHEVNRLCQDSISLGEISVHDNEGLKRHFLELSYRYDTIEAICYANEQDGNYTIISTVGAAGVANGTDRYYGLSGTATNYSFIEYLMDRNGRILHETFSKPGYDPRMRPWYRKAVETGGTSWTPVYVWLEGVVSQDAVVPVYSKEKNLTGVLDTSITLAGISDFLQNLRISRNGQAFIMEKNGDIIASSVIREPYIRENGEIQRISARACNNTPIREAAGILLGNGSQTEGISFRQEFRFDLGGERQLAQVTPYRDAFGIDWLIIVIIPESDLMEGITRNTAITVLLIICLVIVTCILCILLARWITDPIVSMNRSARALARGNWSGFEELNRYDELGELSHSFRLMADQLRESFFSLKSSEERYMSLFQSSADAILLFDRMRLVSSNRAAEEMFSIREDDRGKDLHELFGEIGEEIREIIQVSDLPEGGFGENSVSRHVDGREQYLNIRVTRLPSDVTSLILVQIRDITDERRAIMAVAEKEALKESFARIKRILQFLPDPTLVIDATGHVLFWNQALEEMTGIKAEDMIGEGELAYSLAFFSQKQPLLIDLALDPGLPADRFPAVFTRSGGILVSDEWIEVAGEMKYLSAIAGRIIGNNGEVTGAIETIRDSTRKKAGEDALIMANRKLSLLSSITRHDIMNKIMITKGFLFFLDETELNQEQKEHVATIWQTMAEIERFIEFTRTYQELGLKLPAWQDVREIFARVARGLSGDVRIEINLTGVEILADPLFEKVCYNLLENAVRHGKDLTRIEISVQDTRDGIRITVEDDGGGVSDDEKELIFERGYGSNTGFGLFLAREILSLSGITIRETGKYGEFCRFEIDVPRGKFRREEPGA
ncbi:MAG: PAS domain S-box protein [Methanospirillum sp.]|nr:PAS domain S-box protein [Methanospirillum sp.]